jgi:hypothetical protein
MCLSAPWVMSRSSRLEKGFFVLQTNVVPTHPLSFPFRIEQVQFHSHPDDDPRCVLGQLELMISAVAQRPDPPLKGVA